MFHLPLLPAIEWGEGAGGGGCNMGVATKISNVQMCVSWESELIHCGEERPLMTLNFCKRAKVL